MPRSENQEANELAQVASGYKMSKSKLQDMIEVRENMVSSMPPTEDVLDKNVSRSGETNEECQETCGVEEAWEHEVFSINSSLPTDWRKPIIDYLENPVGSTVRKTKYRALSYVWPGNEFLKKTPEGLLLKCLGDTEAYLAIYKVHSGACGAHQAGHKMKWLMFRQGVYWPNMLKDCIEFAKGCQECQWNTVSNICRQVSCMLLSNHGLLGEGLLISLEKFDRLRRSNKSLS
ncbi:uncharacterized protein LOC127080459 [Lathyrus oleraceus]|uniref:uncharacterized protein LOC127080459 n=1 Tax=Pisum sativum TaxID=3888 RepID=UPI0021CF9469|nr:uncharacterized protein LOC127080459 [Pisum sativum]